ncbi:hypothetical protein DY000_02031109 [Brassica cretica]|uniref:Replication factor A C-terminal domain-containing protein n=1 Tax=Brassica cretica TaxID=69181 RepID=A0ABQ7DDX7_BRACR|nr:hypothetical protein DY000_02031109 [Brassica cretica]
MLLLGGASQPIKRRVSVLPPLRWDCSDSANQEMYALPRCKVIHPLSMSNEPVSPIPEEYFRFRNHSEMLDYFDNKLTLPSRITGKVTGIMVDIRWCYFSCSRCTKKLQRTISGFTCLTCNNSNDVGVLQYYAADGVNPEETPLPFYRIHGWQDNGDDMLGMNLGTPTTGVGPSGLHIKKPPVRASSKMAKKAYVA